VTEEPAKSKLIVGLGNPGDQYESTRHNIGFRVVDQFAQQNQIKINHRGYRGLSGDAVVHGCRVFVLKPQTFMNLSGESVSAFLKMKEVDVSDIMVVSDDIALPFGSIRIRPTGSAGGHNGLKSLIAHLHSQDFPRMRIGVGSPADPAVQIDYVLGRFSRAEEKELPDIISTAAVALEKWITDGTEAAMTAFNIRTEGI